MTRTEEDAKNATKVERTKKIINDYFDGPNGEPNMADAHDYILAILDLIDSDTPTRHPIEY